MVWSELYKNYVVRRRDTRYVLVASGLFIVALVGYFGYRWYERSYNERAQEAIATVLDLYEKAGRDEHSSAVLTEAQRVCELKLAEFSSAAIAPYLRALYADILLQRGETDKATATLAEAVKLMNKNVPVYWLYATKLALMQCDATDQKVRATGEATLKEISENMQTEARLMAQYYRGLAAFNAGKIADARQLWQKLMTSTGGYSPWAKLAEAKLAFAV